MPKIRCFFFCPMRELKCKFAGIFGFYGILGENAFFLQKFDFPSIHKAFQLSQELVFLEMLFSVAFGAPEKSVFTRLFCVFASAMLANFQDRLVMTTSITLRRVSLAKCSGIWREFRERTMKFLYDGKCRKPLILQEF